MDFYGFYTGKEFEAYRFLGAHACEKGTVFRTFAPNAQRISLIGEFNGWQETPMQKVHDGNFWECYAENAQKGMMYKYTERTEAASITVIHMDFMRSYVRTVHPLSMIQRIIILQMVNG